MGDALKDCPFCYGAPDTKMRPASEARHAPWYPVPGRKTKFYDVVFCTKCGAEVERPASKNAREAIKAWNKPYRKDRD